MSSREKQEIGDGYSSSLADLTVNSKPLINMLTILAEECIEHAEVIVVSIEQHLEKVNFVIDKHTSTYTYLSVS